MPEENHHEMYLIVNYLSKCLFYKDYIRWCEYAHSEYNHCDYMHNMVYFTCLELYVKNKCFIQKSKRLCDCVKNRREN